ncbi:hypothetical protein BDQ17DRAFT_1427949 [Cyathus striatus]|nr:hypothetical protein BDQ17DRAFT_1427949 [Cyathus striatus]
MEPLDSSAHAQACITAAPALVYLFPVRHLALAWDPLAQGQTPAHAQIPQGHVRSRANSVNISMHSRAAHSSALQVSSASLCF